MKKNIEQFMDFLKYQRNYSDYTITSYKDDLEIYNKYLILNGLDYKSIEYSDIRYYLKYLKQILKLLQQQDFYTIYSMGKGH